MSFPNKKTLAVIVSDVHLGDIYCKLGEFEFFLNALYILKYHLYRVNLYPYRFTRNIFLNICFRSFGHYYFLF